MPNKNAKLGEAVLLCGCACRSSSKAWHGVTPCLAGRALHDDGSLIKDGLLELLVWQHDGAVQEHLVLRGPQQQHQKSGGLCEPKGPQAAIYLMSSMMVTQEEPSTA